MLGQIIIAAVWIVGIFSALIVSLAVFRVVTETYADLRSHIAVRATRRTEVVDGREYSAVTLSLPLLRERRTGRLALLMERGYRSLPTLRDGRLTSEPQWIKVQYIRNSNGKARQYEWRRYETFDAVAITNVDFMTRRSGFFRTELLMRYSADLDSLKTQR